MARKPATPDTSSKVFVGPIHSGVAGRTDHLPVHVLSGSYVIPADIVSSLGEGNTVHGFKVCQRTFGDWNKMPLDGPTVAVVLAGGEHVIHPYGVEKIGGGSIDAGHRELDRFVKLQREKTIKTLKALPGPKKD